MTRDEELTQARQALAAQSLELAEHKRLLQAVQNKAQGLRNLAAISGDWYWVQDTAYRFTDFFAGPDSGPLGDPGMGGALGSCRWELPGVTPLGKSWTAHRAALDARRPFRDFEYVRVLGDGPPRYFSTSGVPVFDGQDNFTGYCGTTRDISASKTAEKAQRQAFQLLDDIVDNIPISVQLRSVQDGYRTVVWNKAAQELFGLAREETIGRTLHELWPAVHADRVHASDLALVSGGVMLDFPDYEHQTKHRGLIHTHLCKAPLKDANGVVTHVLVIAEDITERQKVEAALRDSEARFRAVVAVLAEGILVRDAQGRIIDCNASAERMFEKTLAEMKGTHSVTGGWKTLREDGSPILDQERPAYLARSTGTSQSNVVMCCHKPDGSVFWGMTNVRPMYDGTGTTPTGFVSSISDIGERKRAEREIIRLNVELENRVTQRTAQLEAANKELEAFAYSVAHDLRSPLTTIDGFCALLQKALPPGANERAHHYMRRIRDGARRMGELTDGLLSLAQVSRTSLSLETVDMSAEATRILMHCAENDVARAVQWTVEPGMLVQADRALLCQVLENLIANAWKFSARKPRADILFGKQAGADGQDVYFVRDQGAGFDMAYADKLFGTFQRLHSPEEFAGSGIGLATVKRIVTRHGGKVWASSVVGEGSTFYFTL